MTERKRGSEALEENPAPDTTTTDPVSPKTNPKLYHFNNGRFQAYYDSITNDLFKMRDLDKTQYGELFISVYELYKEHHQSQGGLSLLRYEMEIEKYVDIYESYNHEAIIRRYAGEATVGDWEKMIVSGSQILRDNINPQQVYFQLVEERKEFESEPDYREKLTKVVERVLSATLVNLYIEENLNDKTFEDLKQFDIEEIQTYPLFRPFFLISDRRKSAAILNVYEKRIQELNNAIQKFEEQIDFVQLNEIQTLVESVFGIDLKDRRLLQITEFDPFYNLGPEKAAEIIIDIYEGYIQGLERASVDFKEFGVRLSDERVASEIKQVLQGYRLSGLFFIVLLSIENNRLQDEEDDATEVMDQPTKKTRIKCEVCNERLAQYQHMFYDYVICGKKCADQKVGMEQFFILNQ